MIDLLEKYCTPLLFMGLVGKISCSKFDKALQENARVIVTLNEKLESLDAARLAST